MRRTRLLALTLLAAPTILAAQRNVSLQGTDPDAGNGTRMLRSPTVSSTQIAFAYAQNIWVADRAGGVARRVTSFQGQTQNPHFSPDGKLLAFSAEYDGNTDVYVVNAA